MAPFCKLIYEMTLVIEGSSRHSIVQSIDKWLHFPPTQDYSRLHLYTCRL